MLYAIGSIGFASTPIFVLLGIAVDIGDIKALFALLLAVGVSSITWRAKKFPYMVKEIFLKAALYNVFNRMT